MASTLPKVSLLHRVADKARLSALWLCTPVVGALGYLLGYMCRVTSCCTCVYAYMLLTSQPLPALQML
jgi:hypothetical protein